jgi:peroxiredoxin
MLLMWFVLWPGQSPGFEPLKGLDYKSGAKVAFETEKPTAVVVFMSARCPCSESHERKLKGLASQFRDVAFVGVHSNADESFEMGKAHFKKSDFPFPVLRDSNSELANRFGAVKTPHAFVLNARGDVLYQGGVDDTHSADAAKKEYLKEALTAIKSGREPDPKIGRTLGCAIQR